MNHYDDVMANENIEELENLNSVYIDDNESIREKLDSKEDDHGLIVAGKDVDVDSIDMEGEKAFHGNNRNFDKIRSESHPVIQPALINALKNKLDQHNGANGVQAQQIEKDNLSTKNTGINLTANFDLKPLEKSKSSPVSNLLLTSPIAEEQAARENEVPKVDLYAANDSVQLDSQLTEINEIHLEEKNLRSNEKIGALDEATLDSDIADGRVNESYESSSLPFDMALDFGNPVTTILAEGETIDKNSFLVEENGTEEYPIEHIDDSLSDKSFSVEEIIMNSNDAGDADIEEQVGEGEDRVVKLPEEDDIDSSKSEDSVDEEVIDEINQTNTDTLHSMVQPATNNEVLEEEESKVIDNISIDSSKGLKDDFSSEHVDVSQFKELQESIESHNVSELENTDDFLSDGSRYQILHPMEHSINPSSRIPIVVAIFLVVICFFICCIRYRRRSRLRSKPNRGKYSALSGGDDFFNGTFSDDISFNEKYSDDEMSVYSNDSDDINGVKIELGGIYEKEFNGGLTLEEVNG